MIEIREVRTRHDLARFVAFPERLYGRHPHYVPKLEGEEVATLSAARNPAFAYCEARGRRDLLPYVPEIFGLINETYAGLYGVVAVSDAQVAFYTKAFFGFINHEFVKVILDAGNRLAAFGIAMPSLSTALQKCRGRLFPIGFLRLLHALRRNDRLDLLLVAVRPELQNKGLPAVLINEVWKAALQYGIRHAHAAPQLETNEKALAMWKPFNPRQHRRRRCYVKAL